MLRDRGVGSIVVTTGVDRLPCAMAETDVVLGSFLHDGTRIIERVIE